MNANKLISTNFFITTFLILISTYVNASTDLEVPLENKFKELTVEDIKDKPRYAIIIQNNLTCLNGFDKNDKYNIDYLNNPSIIWLYDDYFKQSAEAYLLEGILKSSDDVINEGLKEYPNFLKHINIHRKKCFITNEKLDWALNSFQISSDLGSPLAKHFLEIYRKRLGDEEFLRHMNQYK